MLPKERNERQEEHKYYSYRFTWSHLMRPMTLTGTICPVLVGTIIASKSGAMRFDLFFFMLLASILVQASINMFNDYFDFLNGQDQEKWCLVKSVLDDNGPYHHKIPFVAAFMLIIAAIIGIWLAINSSFIVLVVGAFGVLFGYFYSAGSRSLSALGLGELVAAIFLGIVPATLAYMVQGHAIGLRILVIALPFAFLISSMILTNNIRDIEKDKGFRLTLAMRLGRINATRLLTAILILSYFSVFIGMFYRLLSWTDAVVLLALPLAFKLHRAYRKGTSRKEEMKGMKYAALHHWTFSLLLIFGLLI